MADKQDILMGQQLRRIVGQNGVRFPVMSGVVVTSNTDDLDCSVKLTGGDDDTPTDGVLLNVTLGNIAGMYGIPADGADCIVGEVDGPGQLKQLMWASKYDKLYMKADTLVQINDGSKGGIPIVGKVDDNLNTLKSYIKDTLEPNIKNAIDAVGVGSAADGPTAALGFEAASATGTITFEDMENKNVKHG